jgi:hypothetical protein
MKEKGMKGEESPNPFAHLTSKERRYWAVLGRQEQRASSPLARRPTRPRRPRALTRGATALTA